MRKQKLLALGLSLMLLINLPISVVAAWETEPELSIVATQSEDGETVYLEVSINACDEILGIQFSVMYDKTVLEAKSNPSLKSPWSGMLAATNIPTAGEAKVAAASMSGIEQDGTVVATMEFTVIDSSASETSFYLAEVEVSSDTDVVWHDSTAAVTLKLSTKSTSTGGNVSTSTSTGITTAMTTSERLEDTIFLQIGNYAAVKDGSLLHIDSENTAVVPYINSDGRTMVPIRFVAEQMGAEVTWDSDTQMIGIELDGKIISMTIGSREYEVDGEVYEMDTEAVLSAEYNRTMVPIRVISEAFGASVEWLEDDQIVVITSGAEWDLDGTAESGALAKVKTLIAPLYRDFV